MKTGSKTTTTQPKTTTSYTPSYTPQQSTSTPSVNNPTYSSPSLPSEPDYNAINSIFQPQMEYLSKIEQNYNQEYGVRQGQVEREYEPALSGINLEEQKKQQAIEDSRTQGNTAYKSQIGRVRQRYNELMQNANAMYGGTSSIAQGSQELLGRQTQQDMGQAEGDWSRIQGTLAKEELNSKDFFIQKRLELSNAKQKALEDLNMEFRRSLLEVSGQRGQIESAKSSAKLDLLKSYNDQVMNIKNSYDTWNQKLQLWLQEKQNAITLAQQYGANKIEIPGFSEAGISSYSIGKPEQKSTPGNPLQNAQGEMDWDKLSGIISSARAQGLDVAVDKNGNITYKTATKNNSLSPDDIPD
jgi:hypothetical protein